AGAPLTGRPMRLTRRGAASRPPGRAVPEFQNPWMAEGARGSGSWQARRDIVEKVVRPIQDQLEEAEERQSLGELTEGISPHGDLGLTDVDDHIAQLRQRFRSASTPVDYKGNDARIGVT